MRPPEARIVSLGGRDIAYRLRPGASPTILFLSGYASDMDGSKAEAIDEFAARRGIGCLRFDYSGTGLSGGDFAQGTLELWLGEVLAAIDRLTDGPLILVGSSMGGWLALHAALRRKERVVALVGMAAAPDFTEWGFDQAERTAIVRDGMIGPETHRIYRGFWESGQALQLLGGEIAIDCPVRLIHGEQDAEVPRDVAFRLMRALRSADVQLTVIKGAGHRLSQPRELDAIQSVIASLLEPR